MDLGIDPSAVAAGSQELTNTFVMFGTIAFVGIVGRMVFVAFGPGIAKAAPFKNFSAGGFILLAAALFAGGLYASGKTTKATVLFKQHLVEPVIVTWLGNDSCEPASGSYCVVVFEGRQEKIVNWYNKRVSMYEIVNPPQGAVWHTLRPRHRPDLAAGV
ncbi:hypothetical protein AB838_17880 [Rhodobacteraceae bacterium (ex Bugula neritina AB1)]|nr:hypothetical protein AB838_17880 [Rhodobacteraceae bacterium (ex Bugula neritina AB1)]